jgi:hypothetical protein
MSMWSKKMNICCPEVGEVSGAGGSIEAAFSQIKVTYYKI